jgi:molybdenum cofactor cytidylyltransferase
MVVLPSADSAASQRLGMGYSIAAGVAARSDASGWLILPADMPMVRTSTLNVPLPASSKATHHLRSIPGPPWPPGGFAAELYSELVMLTGDEGARRLVARYPAQGVEVDDPGVLLDVDTEDDLARACAAQQQMQSRGPRARSSP